jgi:hypothetical protein
MFQHMMCRHVSRAGQCIRMCLRISGDLRVSACVCMYHKGLVCIFMHGGEGMCKHV